MAREVRKLWSVYYKLTGKNGAHYLMHEEDSYGKLKRIIRYKLAPRKDVQLMRIKKTTYETEYGPGYEISIPVENVIIKDFVGLKEFPNWSRE